FSFIQFENVKKFTCIIIIAKNVLLLFLGKALLDVLMLCSTDQPPTAKELLPLLGALKHMSSWHNAQITVVTQHFSVWQKVASFLSAGLEEPAALDRCVDHREMWRGGLVIREKKVYVFKQHEKHIVNFLLKSEGHRLFHLCPQVFHYYAPVLEFLQLVTLSDLPNFMMSSTTFELGLCGKSIKDQLFLEQLRSLRGKVGALFSLSCTVTPIVQPAANQLSSQRWREFLATGPKSLFVPETEVKGESCHYFLLVQGTDTSVGSAQSEYFQTNSAQQTDWPERSVLHNVENLQRRRQKKRFGLLGPSSSDSLLGPKDGQKNSVALLDAKELLRHFTADGTPTGELQPLVLNRGSNVFQLSPDLSPGKVSQMPFSKASATHYHGIEFCLDHQHSLDKDQSFVRLQSRLIRFETQTTCSKEPEPGSVHDGETLQNADVARLKRRSWDTEIVGGYPRKRLVKSESSDSLCSQSSGSSGTHPSVRSLRRQTARTQSTSSTLTTSAPRGSTSVVAKTLKHHGISSEHKCFEACSKRLFDISKFYLKDLKTSRGLHEEMKKAACSNVKQVIDWVLEKYSKK
uniref:MDM2 binding protein n=1 Tax=Neogobius melanostomus TaxID=47308 RepID=A0A8C6URM7_9GOBI